MSNPEIAKYYLTLQPLAHTALANVNRDNVLDRLNECFSGNFAWEVTNESTVLDGTMVSTTVMVYTPGRIYSGRSTRNIKEYATNHLEAILSACRPLICANPSTNMVQPQQPVQSAPQAPANGNMTPDQIMAAVSGNQQPAPQPQQQQPQQSQNPDADLPFYFGPKDPNAPSDVFQAYLQEYEKTLPPEYRGKDPSYYRPSDKIQGYTPCQFERMVAFKKKWEVINDSMMTNYLHMWKPDLPNPVFNRVINPDNIDEFLAWTDRLGKQDC